MPDVVTAWAAIFLVSAITLVSRVSGPLLMQHIAMSAGVERFLQNLSLSVIAALVGSMLARGGLRELAAVAVAAVVMRLSRKAIWAMAAGMVCGAGWSYIFA